MSEPLDDRPALKQLAGCATAVHWFRDLWNNTFLPYVAYFKEVPAWADLDACATEILTAEAGLTSGLEELRPNPYANSLDPVTHGYLEIALEALREFVPGIEALKRQVDERALRMGSHRGTTYEQDIANWLCEDVRELILDQVVEPLDALARFKLH